MAIFSILIFLRYGHEPISKKIPSLQRQPILILGGHFSLPTAGRRTISFITQSNGVYCRPLCVARLAKPGHVQVQATCEAAKVAGLHLCKRRKPKYLSPIEQPAKVNTLDWHKNILCRL